MKITRPRQVVIEETFEKFEPRHYLKTYYSKIGSENLSLLEFFSKAYQGIKEGSVMLEFGGGPTIYPLITAASKVKTIHFADYLDKNLNEVKLWKDGSLEAFSWQKFFKKALHLEGNKKVSAKQILLRKNLVRKKITKFLYCDAFKKDPLGKKYRHYYDVINTNFVTESITDKKEVWENLIVNICSMLKEDGILIMTAIKDAGYYHVGRRAFPSVRIIEEDIIQVLTKLGFKETSFLLSSVPAEVQEEEIKGYTGYKGLIFLKAEKVSKPHLLF